MASNMRCGDLEQGIDYVARPELAIAALLHMMTRFPDAPKLSIAASITGHLRLIADDDRHTEAVRAAASLALTEWQTRIAAAFEPFETPGLPH